MGHHFTKLHERFIEGHRCYCQNNSTASEKIDLPMVSFYCVLRSNNLNVDASTSLRGRARINLEPLEAQSIHKEAINIRQ